MMKTKKLALLPLIALRLTGCNSGGNNIPVSAEKGDKGDKGDPGIDGKDGESLLTGKGAPSSSLGKDGDSYVDTLTWDYYTKADGVWTKAGNFKGGQGDKGDTGATGPKGDKGDQGIKGDQGQKGDKGDTGSKGDTGATGPKGDKGDTGIAGKDGESLLTGKGVPSSSLGKDGDSYVDTETWDYYTKADGVWTKAGNFKGGQGDKGDTGATGPKGDKGDKGDKGEKGETGAKGDKGDKGVKGDPGKDAVTYIPAIFNNYDGTKLYEAYYEKGTDVVYDGPTPTKTEKDSDGNIIKYQFTGWDKSLENIQKPRIYTAQFEVAAYTVTFKNYDGSILYKTEVKAGGKAVYSGNVPVKKTSEDSSGVRTEYTFTGWDADLNNICSNRVFTAQFASNETYRCTFVNEDGTVLATSYCKKGGKAQYTGETPKKDYVNKDGICTIFTFKNWDVPLTNIQAPTTFKAQYEESTAYECKFVNDDGSLLYSTIVPQNGTAVYDGDKPFKEGIVNGTSITRYKFTGWIGARTNITAPSTFTATYAAESFTGYKVTFLDADGKELCHDYAKTGSTAIYPKNYNTLDWSYDDTNVTLFAGWDKDLTNVTAETTYKAVYKTITRHQNGEFPLEKVTDETILNALKENEVEPDERGYYTYDGVDYGRRVEVIGYDEEEGDDLYGYVYYKVIPIRWRYLSQKDGNVQYLSEEILTGTGDYREPCWNRTSHDSGLKRNNYKESDIRQWLNNDFIEEAFYYDSSLIQTVRVDNSASTTRNPKNPNVCENTQDKVYLLSYQDVINPEYGLGTTTSRIAYEHDAACSWWTRTPGDDARANSALAVGKDGGIGIAFHTGNQFGIRPALNFKFE